MNHIEYLKECEERVSEKFETLDFEFKPPLTDSQIKEIEDSRKFTFPLGLRTFYKNISGKLIFDWVLNLDYFEELSDSEGYMVECGELRFDPDDYIVNHFNWLSFEEEPFLYKHFLSLGGGKLEIDDFFPLVAVLNGDFIVEVLAGKLKGQVYYINHESLYSSRLIANSFSEFLDNWVGLLGISPEIWELEKFIDKDGLLSSKTNNAKLWLKAIIG